MTTRIIIAANRRLVREGLRALLESVRDFAVVADVDTFIELHDGLIAMQPEIAVVDFAFFGNDGLCEIKRLLAKTKGCKIILVSMHVNAAAAENALSAGASAFLSMDNSSNDLEDAIHSALEGVQAVAMPAPMRLNEPTRPILERRLPSFKPKQFICDSNRRLTPRERDIIRMAADGNTSRQIAEILTISERTVETHRARAMHKLGLECTLDLVRYGLRHGLVTLD